VFDTDKIFRIFLDFVVSRCYYITIVLSAFCLLQVEISNFVGFTGSKITHMFNNLIGEATPEVINLVKPYVIPQIIELIQNAVNAVIIPLGITFQDLLNCLLGIGNCPFEFP
jgi:ABC-type enterobactin transport system permease subunit